MQASEPVIQITVCVGYHLLLVPQDMWDENGWFRVFHGVIRELAQQEL